MLVPSTPNGRDLAARVASMVDAVTEVVISVQAQRTAERASAESGERTAASGPEIVDGMAALVNAMTDVVGVMRTRLLPALQPPADGTTRAA